MKIRYDIDPETELPHIYRHNVSEQDVEEVLRRSGEDRLGREGSRVAIGCTSDGRYVRVIGSVLILLDQVVFAQANS